MIDPRLCVDVEVEEASGLPKSPKKLNFLLAYVSVFED